MRLWELYHEDIPEFLREMGNAAVMRRLENVGMNCGCEYTSFPTYLGLGSHSRYDHSVGVGLIVWHFTHSSVQASAGLFHDIATPVFAHVVDFLRGDHLNQEATEEGTLSAVQGSPELQDVLARTGINAEETGDYHRYPIADNDAPRLSADRLEYTLSNMVNFGFASRADTARFYRNLIVSRNEDSVPELAFRDAETAIEFSRIALKLSRLYESQEDRYAMEMLAELLRNALKLRVIMESDLNTTEPLVIKKLLSDERTAFLWERYASLSAVKAAVAPSVEGEWRQIRVKRRYMDPLVHERGRVSGIFPDYRDALDAYLSEDMSE